MKSRDASQQGQGRRSIIEQWLLLPPFQPDGLFDVRSYRFATLINYCALLGLSIHLLLLIIFTAIGIIPMALVNVVSTLLWSSVILLNRRGWTRTVLILAAAELFMHASLAVYYVGDYGGFHYGLFLVALLAYFAPNCDEAKKLAATVATVVIFIGLHFYAEEHKPIFVLEHETLDLFFYFNTVTTFVVLAALSRYYNNVIDTAEKRLQNQNALLETLAGTDPLTGLLNRRSLLAEFEQELQRHKRTQEPLSVGIADIDNFKSINDRYGHQTGDIVLVRVAHHIREHLRGLDVSARWGGEEFLFLLPNTDSSGAFAVAERIREAIAKLDIMVEGVRLDITITIGLSSFRPDDSIEGCIQRADDALYQGKHSGKNRTMVR